MSGAAVRVRDVSKRFRIYHRRNLTLKQAVLHQGRGTYEEFMAVRDVSLEVPQAGSVGIIGENGSGKSTLLKCIAGILKPDAGSIHVAGRLAALLELGAGFHPEYTGRENIYLNGALLGLPRRYIDQVVGDIVDFSELSRFIDNPVRTYSSGMYARLGFAIAVHLDPDILVIDEILSVGDEGFQRRCYERIAQMKAEGRTMVMVSHALETVRDLCDHCIWMEHGEIRAEGQASAVVSQYIAEVDTRESERMRHEAAEVYLRAPGGRAGVGVTSVRMIGPNGPAQVFQTGDPFDLVIDYHAPSVLRDVRFYASFLREDGVLAFATSTHGLDLEAAELPPRGEVCLRIASLPLLEGLFRAGVIISDIRSNEPYTVLEAAFPFRVQSPERIERGLAIIDSTWELLVPALERSE